MPEPAERKAAARAAARRREATTLLAVAEVTCRTARAELGNGISPARGAADGADRRGQAGGHGGSAAAAGAGFDGPQAAARALALRLVALGMGTKQIASAVGVSERAVRYYVSGRPCP